MQHFMTVKTFHNSSEISQWPPRKKAKAVKRQTEREREIEIEIERKRKRKSEREREIAHESQFID